MASVKIDIHRSARSLQQNYPLHTVGGVTKALTDLHKLHEKRLNGNVDIATLIIDLQIGIAASALTKRETEVIYWLYERGFTPKETARQLDISVKAVYEYRRRATKKIAQALANTEGYRA